MKTLIITLALSTSLLSADTLFFRDGRQMHGKLLAKTDQHVAFRAKGHTSIYETAQVAGMETQPNPVRYLIAKAWPWGKR